MYHPQSPTGWVDWEGPLEGPALHLNRFPRAGSPWDARLSVQRNVKLRFGRAPARMDVWRATVTGDELLFVLRGRGRSLLRYGASGDQERRLCDADARHHVAIESAAPTTALLIEATNVPTAGPDKGLVGPHAIFDPPPCWIPKIDDKSWRSRRGHLAREDQARRRISTVTVPYNRWTRWAGKGDLAPVRINVADIRR